MDPHDDFDRYDQNVIQPDHQKEVLKQSERRRYLLLIAREQANSKRLREENTRLTKQRDIALTMAIKAADENTKLLQAGCDGIDNVLEAERREKERLALEVGVWRAKAKHQHGCEVKAREENRRLKAVNDAIRIEAQEWRDQVLPTREENTRLRALLARCPRHVEGNKGAWEALNLTRPEGQSLRRQRMAECAALLSDIDAALSEGEGGGE